MSFRVRLHARDKATRRTCIVDWPPVDNIRMTMMTGEMRPVTNSRGGYSEYNDRGEPVLDSWTVPQRYVTFGHRPYIDYRRLFAELDAGVDGPSTMAILTGR